MADCTITEEAEGALWRAERALAALAHLAAAANGHAAEIEGDELSALLDLLREEIARARQTARFDPPG